MNYRHQYHAGNFADVLKHIVLLTLIQSLSKKNKPWCYLDTHAGRGQYDLTSIEALKTQEYKWGIEKCVDYFKSLSNNSSTKIIHPILKNYFSLIEDYQYPHFYPGSPLIIASQLRAQDRMILVEKQPQEVAALKDFFRKYKKDHPDFKNEIAIHEQDAYQSIKAFLPPKERRGLILIDPPFEESQEWQRITDSLIEGLQRFASGIYAVWYPIKERKTVKAFQQALSRLNDQSLCDQILIIELMLYPEDFPQIMKGAGMVIINPPWQFQDEIQQVLNQVIDALTLGESTKLSIYAVPYRH